MSQKLDKYILDHTNVEFLWGSNDCCTFASDWVEEKSGVNPLKELGHHGKYKTYKGALKLLKKLGGMEKVVSAKLTEIPVAFAQVGDVVCGDLDYGDTMGICIGVGSLFLGEESLVTRPTLDMKKAWRV
jgi:hypothetical protein